MRRGRDAREVEHAATAYLYENGGPRQGGRRRWGRVPRHRVALISSRAVLYPDAATAGLGDSGDEVAVAIRGAAVPVDDFTESPG